MKIYCAESNVNIKIRPIRHPYRLSTLHNYHDLFIFPTKEPRNLQLPCFFVITVTQDFHCCGGGCVAEFGHVGLCSPITLPSVKPLRERKLASVLNRKRGLLRQGEVVHGQLTVRKCGQRWCSELEKSRKADLKGKA